ncbi:hypothetical protein [Polaribacter porphyrae]|uniref:Secretion system C-terminal sorting domain-containing protein n=1 Tax=Polaribacter porphyrae TaxID=1137780 RepID=A0A2S7WSS4_9FLAO|nr:hypothetical protein [Polaribacter porphyrae]PQJ80655.1 hypothetical protein BTO18_16390 [Polaribacter porphyrae]
MNKKTNTLKGIFFLFLCCFSLNNNAQNKVLFVKDVPVKMKSQSTYSFFIGYEVEEDSDLAMDISGGSNKFWAGKTVPVAKGKGVFQFTISTNKTPSPGKGYRVLVSVRERGGDWKTEKASSIIRNVEITSKDKVVTDDATFSLATPTSLTSREKFEFEINYKASEPRLLQVALWNGGQWIGASKNKTIQTGEGTVKVTISTGAPAVGNTYRYVLYYGSGAGFPNTNIVSKELSGIQITKAVKTLTLDDLKEKSVTIAINKNSSELTLPIQSSFEFIRIITTRGQIIKESKNTNTILINDLPKGSYYAITNTDDFYKFSKF